MPRKPSHKNLQNLIQYTISCYYVAREQDPAIKLNIERHLSLIEKINNEYLKELRVKYPEWENEESKKAVKEQIDFLTQIFTNIEKEKQRKKDLQAWKKTIESKKKVR